MKQKNSISIPAVGAGSLLAIFAVLCLTVFALMSLTTVQAEKRLADVSNHAVKAYYAADLQAEALFARLRAGEQPETISIQENQYTYQCAISDNQYLDVTLEKTDAGWRILRWQATARESTGKTDALPVWQGAAEKEDTP